MLWMTDILMKSMSIFESKFDMFIILTNCNEILSWTIEIWMKFLLVNNINCNIVNL